MCCLSDQTRPAHASDDFDAATVRELYLPKRDQYDLGQSKEPHALNILIDRVVLQDLNTLGMRLKGICVFGSTRLSVQNALPSV